MRRALIYALGGGLGHRTRGGALAQALASLGVETTLLVPARERSARRSTAAEVICARKVRSRVGAEATPFVPGQARDDLSAAAAATGAHTSSAVDVLAPACTVDARGAPTSAGFAPLGNVNPANRVRAPSVVDVVTPGAPLTEGAALGVANVLGVRTWEVSRTADVVPLRREVDAAIEACAPDLFIVDALPDGVLGELDPLPSVGRTAALLRLHRGVANGQLAGMLAQYDLQLDLEAPLGWCAGLEAVGPIVSKPALALLEVDVALMASDAALAELFQRVAPILEGAGRSVRLVDSAHEPEPFDVSCARVVIGAAGYNLTWECAGAGVFHLAVPRPRRFDDQFRRASEVAERPHSPEVLVDRALALTAPDAPKRAPHPVLTPRALAARLLEQ